MRTAFVTALLTLAAAAPAHGALLSAPDATELADRVPGRTPTITAPIRSFASWGGRYLTADGAWVTVLASDAYPRDDARAQQWADFLDSLEHGAEIGRVTLVLTPPNEIQAACGPNAVACYLAKSQTIYAPGNDPSPTSSAESIVAHEYGHHIEASRSNAPWDGLDYGTKRWATAMGICTGVAAGKYFPGAEAGGRYALNPGEGFAESYRVLNEKRLGLPTWPWHIVTTAFYPDDGAFAAIEQDIASPWTGNTVSTTSGWFAGPRLLSRRAGPSVEAATWTMPLDGDVSVTMRASRRLRARVDLYAGDRLLGTATAAGSTGTVTGTLCGDRDVTTVVTRLAGDGRYTIALSHP